MKPLNREEVYRLTAKIPRGMVSTYGLLAEAAGNRRASRAVGRLMKLNTRPIQVPCHRVVYSDGRIGGYAVGLGEKVRLLESEGVYTVDGWIVDFKEKLFRDFK